MKKDEKCHTGLSDLHAPLLKYYADGQKHTNRDSIEALQRIQAYGRRAPQDVATRAGTI